MKTASSLANKRICRYIRVSTDKQEGDRQIFSTDSWAKYNGLFIQESFEDTEGSNSRDLSAKRVRFQKMMTACEAGDFDIIVVDSLDRFGFKNNKELQHYLYMLEQWGVELWSVSQGCISEDDVATIFNTTAAAITSEKEQKEKALRILEGRINNSKKGNYSGGPPPYGCDVVCYGPDGVEKWRSIWMGKSQRIKVNPDGSEEIYNGRNNSPSRDHNDVLRLAPSIRKERIENVKKMFKWFSEELISFYQIAVRLNKEENKPNEEAKIWNKGHIQAILYNPVFIGMPADNKKGQGRFYEYKNGKVKPVSEFEENRVRTESDYWRPEKPIFEPIVEPEVWSKVHKKLSERSNKKHSPSPHRKEVFWLQPFMYCAGCGRKMRAQITKGPKKNHNIHHYTCSIYSAYGSTNPFNCESNAIKMDMIHGILEAYLKDVKEKLMFDNNVSNLSKAFEFNEVNKIACVTGIKISVCNSWKKYIAEQLAQVKISKNSTIAEAYKNLDKEQETGSDLIKQIKTKQDEFEKVYQHGKYLTDFAKERANEEMNALAAEIKRLRSLLAPQDRALKIEREFFNMGQAIDAMQIAFAASNSRQKADSLAKLIEKINCKFEPRTKENEHLVGGNFGAKRRKAVLTEIQIVPVSVDKELFKINNIGMTYENLSIEDKLHMREYYK